MSFKHLTDRAKSFVSQNKWLILCMVAYRLSLELGYIIDISPRFTVSLMATNLNWGKYVISVLLMAASIVVFPKDFTKPSTGLYGILYALIFVPMSCYYWLNDQPTVFMLVEAICFMLIALGLRFSRKPLPVRAPRIPAIPAKVGQSAVWLLFAVYVAATFALIFINGGIDLRTLSWNDLYQVRAENNLTGIWGYLLNWCAKAFMPFFFVYFLIRRKYLAVVFVCLLQVFTFMAFGFKAFLMAVVLLVGVSCLMWLNEKRFNENLAGALTLGTVASVVIDKMGITDVPMLLLPYRTLFLPAQGQFEYYDFFTHHDYLYFSEGMIGRLLGIPYPYDDQIGRIVNVYIYGPQKQSNGNTGVFSYGFADAGFAGMLLAAAIILLILVVVDKSSKKLPAIIPVCAMAYQMFIMNDNSIFISLNTGGILWTLALIVAMNWIYPTLPEIKPWKLDLMIERLFNKCFGWLKRISQ